MRIAIFGGSGKTGRLLIEQTLASGHQVMALARHPDRFPLVADRLDVVAGEIADPSAVSRTVAGADAVLSTIGVPFSRRPITIYSTAAHRIVEAMRSHGVQRLAVTSSSAVESHPATEGWLFEHVLQPMVVNGIGRTTYDDMRQMEQIVSDSGLRWTIARPSGLFSRETVSDYRVTAQHSAGAYTARADLAAFLLAQADDEQWVGATPEVHTDENPPGLLSVIWNEGIRGGAERPTAGRTTVRR